MAIVFVLRAYNLGNSLLLEKRLSSLPIRVGRNALADFQIKQSHISDFHALVEDVEGRLYVRDLNSKNGVYATPTGHSVPVRVEPQAAVDLQTCGFQFFLGVQIRIAIEFEQGATTVSNRTSTAIGSVLGNQAVLRDSGASGPYPAMQGQNPGLDPRALPPLPSSAPPPPAGAAWDPRVPVRSPSHPPGALAASPGAGGLPPLPPGMMSPAAGHALPPLAAGGGFDSAPAPTGWSPEAQPQGRAHTGVLNLSLESMALLGLQELAGSLVPGKSLTTTGDVARFITKLHDSIEVFCRCFIPLREGYAQFVSSLDLQKASLQRSMMRSQSYMAIEGAREPDAVAAALLDWRDRSMDAPKAIEGIFADLMIHQVALLDGVMQGVRGLLEQLSPENIEAQVGPPGAFALDRAKARYKALWETFSARYEELAEEKQAFAHIFGPQFTEAYRDYRKQRQE